MARIDKKLEQIQLQHEISELLRKDNGVSCHFDYHVNLLSEDETISLNLLTYNVKHNEYMLLHTCKGASSIVCLTQMLQYISSINRPEVKYSYTIRWSKRDEGDSYTSYFYGNDENDALRKFLHEKDPNDYTWSIEQNPLS